jgi:hypothetical protein
MSILCHHTDLIVGDLAWFDAELCAPLEAAQNNQGKYRKEAEGWLQDRIRT